MRDAARTKLDSFGVVQGTCGARNFDRPGNSTNLAFETWDSNLFPTGRYSSSAIPRSQGASARLLTIRHRLPHSKMCR